jgi:anaerobic selenocysteine-containing dehydrogenase/Fe-S-cluster-containing dehydrogenase component
MSLDNLKNTMNQVSGLVTKIGRAGQMDRREFLKGAGVASALGIAGCADSPKQEIFPHVKGSSDQIPGVAVWYRSTCTECSAGCGIEVRTREGRAVKIEGSRENPINRGGLCAIGQASLQDLYDPDRVRQPLKKVKENGKDVFKPIDWVDAYNTVAAALLDNSGSKAFITHQTSGALSELLDSFCSSYNMTHVTYEALSSATEAKASELVYGVAGIPRYDFSKAEVILNFGADFLETWVSPCEFARDWSKSRKSSKPVRVFHVEPRLSLTGANADSWLKCAPGSETSVALAVLKEILSRGANQGGAANVAMSLVKNIDIDDVAKSSGVKRSTIVSVADYLANSKSSLVISGGSAGSTDSGVSLHVVTALMNVLLGNVGKTVHTAQVRKVDSDPQQMISLIEQMNKGAVKLLFVDRSNPAYSLPAGAGFDYAVKNVKLVVSFSNKIDETAKYADIIMPSSTSLESWGDSRPYYGVYSLIQPSMTPVFNTKSLGDILVDFANGMSKESVVAGAKSFKEFLMNSWKKIHSQFGVSTTFDKFWLECLERGGFFPQVSVTSNAQVSSGVTSVVSKEALSSIKPAKDSLVLYPFASIKTFDGRAANRPWLQETPDPLSQIVWDSWAEMHPSTAKKFGLAQGDVATLRNKNGELNMPVYISEHVHENIVAVPIGHSHETFGRYAEQVTGGNVFSVAPAKLDSAKASFPLVGATVEVARSRLSTDLVNMDGSRSQLGREIARTKIIETADDLHHSDHHDAHGSHGGHGGHHEPKQMYTQREHPLYKWGMSVDLAACTGCSACVVACYAENNIYTVGKELTRQGREMAWLRIDRYIESGENEELTVHFMPMMCQHCGNAPCEPVCPVYATYHNEEGLNSMVYNRCVGTRYCANNCSYKVRRFNWFEYEMPEPLTWQLNPDVVTRSVGVMEKCTFCVQRIIEAKDHAKDEGRMVADGEIKPACVQSCPTEALVFGNLNDPNSQVSKLAKADRSYKVLDHHLNTQPSVVYQEDIKYKSV